METKKVTEQMKAELLRPLPAEAVKPHPTKTYLSTIKAIYVTERLNDVFGVGAWQIKTKHITTSEKGMVVCKTTFTIPEYGIYYECFGGNDNADLGDGFKGSVTDSITKIGSYLGIGIDVFKGKQSQLQTNGHTASAKPKIENSQLKALCARIEGGDIAAYDKALIAFSFDSTQKAVLNNTYKQMQKQTA